MNELDRIREVNNNQLGSLEDTAPVKRLDPAQIRKLRAHAHEQTKLGNSIVRNIQHAWDNFINALKARFSSHTDTCGRNGHTPYPANGSLRCYDCGIEIQSPEQLVHTE